MKGLLPGYKKCFFCGPATGGLSLHIRYEGGCTYCEFFPEERFQGYQGMLHGGIVSGILDEVMWWALFVETGKVCVTWKLEVKFKRPVVCGERHIASGRLVKNSGGTYILEGSIKDDRGEECALGQGYFKVFKGPSIRDIVEYLDFRGVQGEIRDIFKSFCGDNP
ncbi:MAG: PaaI family thioesterase [Syntrophorhabdaceae bacterium]|nr:PaaI family thioesterase [Syntrophorhabdaceae bacterium]